MHYGNHLHRGYCTSNFVFQNICLHFSNIYLLVLHSTFCLWLCTISIFLKNVWICVYMYIHVYVWTCVYIHVYMGFFFKNMIKTNLFFASNSSKIDYWIFQLSLQHVQWTWWIYYTLYIYILNTSKCSKETLCQTFLSNTICESPCNLPSILNRWTSQI